MRFKNINRAGERPDPAAGLQTKISGTELKKKWKNEKETPRAAGAKLKHNHIINKRKGEMEWAKKDTHTHTHMHTFSGSFRLSQKAGNQKPAR